MGMCYVVFGGERRTGGQSSQAYRHSKPELGGDGNRIDMAYANWALDHGVPEHEVRDEIATRDLSKKGGQRGQKAYLDRTIKAAYKYIARHH